MLYVVCNFIYVNLILCAAAQLMHKDGAHEACEISDFGLVPHAQNFLDLQKQKTLAVPLKFRILNLPCISKTYEVSKYYDLKLNEGCSSEISDLR